MYLVFYCNIFQQFMTALFEKFVDFYVIFLICICFNNTYKTSPQLYYYNWGLDII